jgi:hypothetical protein
MSAVPIGRSAVRRGGARPRWKMLGLRSCRANHAATEPRTSTAERQPGPANLWTLFVRHPDLELSDVGAGLVPALTITLATLRDSHVQIRISRSLQRARPGGAAPLCGPSRPSTAWCRAEFTAQHLRWASRRRMAGDLVFRLQSCATPGIGLIPCRRRDYDEGQSELLFWYSGYNHDGYALFDSSLARRVDYLWSYH